MSKAKWDTRVGGMVRDLPEGREMHLVLQIANVRISVGPAGAAGWDDSWEYLMEEVEAAVAVFETWDGEGDAPGPWVRSTWGAAGGFRRRGPHL